MPKPSEKTFFKVTELSEQFSEACPSICSDMTDVRGETRFQVQASIQLWQAKAMFAIAQQLTMIAQHLGEIVAKSKEPK